VSVGKDIEIDVPDFESEVPLESSDCTSVDYLEVGIYF